MDGKTQREWLGQGELPEITKIQFLAKFFKGIKPQRNWLQIQNANPKYKTTPKNIPIFQPVSLRIKT